LALTAYAVLVPVSARAEYISAKSSFESLPQADQAEIVIGLIATGDFAGLVDYGFTRRLYRAVTKFETREGFDGDGVLEANERRRLNSYTDRFLAELGIEIVQHPASGAKLPVPKAKFNVSTTVEKGFAYERNDETLSLNLVAYPASERSFESLFDRFSTSTSTRQVDYKVLRGNFFVTSGTFKGRSFYTWMSRVASGTTGFTLTWSREIDTFGRKLSVFLANAFDPMDTGPGSDRPGSVEDNNEMFSGTPEAGSAPLESSTTNGTGFFISTAGHLVTNAHVVERCRQIRVRLPGAQWSRADLVSAREDIDLALLRTKERASAGVARIRSSSSVKLGEDAIAFGFPLTGALSADGNLTVGNISSLSGWQSDRTKFQISVPVQPGNSGGPLVDRSGLVIGVIVEKLDALEIAKVTGDIPQNVNFAIKSDVLVEFLEWIGTSYQVAFSGAEMSTSDIGSSVQTFTALVECSR
jgi:S1-C subfamily serine protease